MMRWRQCLLSLYGQFRFPHATRTVKYAFPIFIVAIAATSIAALQSSGKNYVYFELVPNTTPQQVRLMVHAVVPVNAVVLDVEFDPVSMQVIGIDKSQSVISLWTAEPTVMAGKVHIEGGTYRRGFIGEHLIATLLITTDSPAATLTMKKASLYAGDGSGRTLDIVPTQGDITVYASVVVESQSTGDTRPSLVDADVQLPAESKPATRRDFIDFSIALFRQFVGE